MRKAMLFCANRYRHYSDNLADKDELIQVYKTIKIE